MDITIYTDADACPVKSIIDGVAEQYEIPSVFVSSYAHFSAQNYYSKVVMVDADPEAVDLYITNQVKPGDVVITQDNGLAVLVLQKGVSAMSPRGSIFSESDSQALLNGRFEGIQMKRRKIRGRGPSKFKKSDQEAFKIAFLKLLNKPHEQ
ncbi:DUF188 domain-containing protein [Alteribacillus sp. HJP-4]|uniref:YaiI/YqxD family protein n=1 Tax=Alteribacillus sp. HJP-4 TaxID=2775394 RepID=UPI0035CD182F